MAKDDGSIGVSERISRIETCQDDHAMRIRKLETSWAKATGIIVAAQAILLWLFRLMSG